MNRRKFLLSFAAAGTQVACTSPQPRHGLQPLPMTQNVLNALRTECGAPALGAAVSRRGLSHHVWVAGERKRRSNVPVSVDDSWHVGSITKSMTATLVARLVDAGAVQWDETIGDVLGSSVLRMRQSYAAANFRHLLSHNASLPRELVFGKWRGYSRDVTLAFHERKRYATSALEMEPIGPIASQTSYSNLGYVVAAAMLEEKLKRSWESLVRDEVFKPLGLGTAAVGYDPPSRKGRTDQPIGHPGGLWSVISALGTDPNDAAMSPAGLVYLSLGDLMTYLAAHRDRTQFLAPESWRTLHTPAFEGSYAMGWVVHEDGSLVHDGSIGSWYATVRVDASAGIAAASVANTFTESVFLATKTALECAALYA